MSSGKDGQKDPQTGRINPKHETTKSWVLRRNAPGQSLDPRVTRRSPVVALRKWSRLGEMCKRRRCEVALMKK